MYPQQHRLITAEALRRLRSEGSAKVALTEPQQIAILDGSAGEDAPSLATPEQLALFSQQ